MQPEEKHRLTWEDATERFLDAAELTKADRPGPVQSAMDNIFWVAHHALSGMEPVRAVSGAGVNTRDNPQRVVDYQPAAHVGGFFDRPRTQLVATQRRHAHQHQQRGLAGGAPGRREVRSHAITLPAEAETSA